MCAEFCKEAKTNAEKLMHIKQIITFILYFCTSSLSSALSEQLILLCGAPATSSSMQHEGFASASTRASATLTELAKVL